MGEQEDSLGLNSGKEAKISSGHFSSFKFEDPPNIHLEKPKMPWKNSSPTHYQSIGLGLTLSYSLILSPLAGLVVGWVIEQQYENSSAMTWGLLIGAILGFITIFLTLNKNK